MPGFQARKRFGQHFLNDQSALQQMAHAIGQPAQNHIVEIGPGRGALTEHLLALTTQLDLIEIDRDLVVQLQRRYPQLSTYEGDVLKFDFNTLAKPDEKLRVVGNLPYNISTPLLFHLFEQINVIQDMHFLLQKEVAERLAAKVNTSNYSRLTVMAQYFCQMDILFDVPPESFTPPPKVNSAYIRMLPYQAVTANDPAHFSAIVKQAFTYRRKTIHNSLRSFINDEQLAVLGLDPKLRPQQLTVADFVSLSNAV